MTRGMVCAPQPTSDEHILWSVAREGMEIVTGIYWVLGNPETPLPGRN